jgi:hypothetical protein
MNVLGIPSNSLFALGQLLRFPETLGTYARVGAACTLALATCACNAPRQVSDSGFGAYEVSLATWDDSLAIGWYDTRDGNAEIYVRMLDAEKRPKGGELRLTYTAEQSYEVDLATLGDDLAIAWYEKAADTRLPAELGLFERGGKSVWQRALGVRGNSRNPVVRAFGGALFCAWIEADDAGAETVRGGWWNADGTVRQAPTILGPAGATTWNLNAAIGADGTAYVVYDTAMDSESEELFVASLASGESRVTQLTPADGFRSKYPDLALTGDRAALTWSDERDGNREVYLAVGSPAELDGKILAHAQRVTTTKGESIGAYVAWTGDRLGLSWSDDTVGNYEVYFEPFAADGRSAGPAQRLTTTKPQSLIPSIRPWRDGFAIAWSEVTFGRNGGHADDTRSEVVIDFVH